MKRDSYVECVHFDPEVDKVQAAQRKSNGKTLAVLTVVVVVLAVGVGVTVGVYNRNKSRQPVLEAATTEEIRAPSDVYLGGGATTQPSTAAPGQNASLTEGIAAYNAQNYGGAVLALDQALQAEPENGIAYSYRGLSYYALERYGTAMADFGRALSFSGEDAQLYALRGMACYQLKFYLEAEKDLTRALELDPNVQNARAYRALAYDAQGRPDLAQADRAAEPTTATGAVVTF